MTTSLNAPPLLASSIPSSGVERCLLATRGLDWLLRITSCVLANFQLFVANQDPLLPKGICHADYVFDEGECVIDEND